jgi:hypothetical protein
MGANSRHTTSNHSQPIRLDPITNNGNIPIVGPKASGRETISKSQDANSLFTKIENPNVGAIRTKETNPIYMPAG